jgi:hypothetical protein
VGYRWCRSCQRRWGCQLPVRSREAEPFLQKDTESLGQTKAEKRAEGGNRNPDVELLGHRQRGAGACDQGSRDDKQAGEVEVDIARTEPLTRFAFETFTTDRWVEVGAKRGLAEEAVAATGAS